MLQWKRTTIANSTTNLDGSDFWLGGESSWHAEINKNCLKNEASHTYLVAGVPLHAPCHVRHKLLIHIQVKITVLWVKAATVSAFSSTTHGQGHAGCQCRSRHDLRHSTELWCPRGPPRLYSGTSMLSFACMNFQDLFLPSTFQSVCCWCL